MRLNRVAFEAFTIRHMTTAEITADRGDNFLYIIRTFGRLVLSTAFNARGISIAIYYNVKKLLTIKALRGLSRRLINLNLRILNRDKKSNIITILIIKILIII